MLQDGPSLLTGRGGGGDLHRRRISTWQKNEEGSRPDQSFTLRVSEHLPRTQITRIFLKPTELPNLSSMIITCTYCCTYMYYCTYTRKSVDSCLVFPHWRIAKIMQEKRKPQLNRALPQVCSYIKRAALLFFGYTRIPYLMDTR